MKVNCLKTTGNYQVMLFGCFLSSNKLEAEIAYFHNNLSNKTISLVNPDNPNLCVTIFLPEKVCNLKRPSMLLNVSLSLA